MKTEKCPGCRRMIRVVGGKFVQHGDKPQGGLANLCSWSNEEARPAYTANPACSSRAYHSHGTRCDACGGIA